MDPYPARMPHSERIADGAHAATALRVRAVRDAAARLNEWQRSQAVEMAEDLNVMALQNVDPWTTFSVE